MRTRTIRSDTTEAGKGSGGSFPHILRFERAGSRTVYHLNDEGLAKVWAALASLVFDQSGKTHELVLDGRAQTALAEVLAQPCAKLSSGTTRFDPLTDDPCRHFGSTGAERSRWTRRGRDRLFSQSSLSNFVAVVAGFDRHIGVRLYSAAGRSGAGYRQGGGDGSWSRFPPGMRPRAPRRRGWSVACGHFEFPPESQRAHRQGARSPRQANEE